MVDLAQAFSEVKSLPDHDLERSLSQKDGPIPGFLALAELHERKRVRQSAPSPDTERPSMAQEYMGLNSARKGFAAGGAVPKGLVPEGLGSFPLEYHDAAVSPLSLYNQPGKGGIVDLVRPGMPNQPAGLASLMPQMPGAVGQPKKPEMLAGGGIVGLARGGNVYAADPRLYAILDRAAAGLPYGVRYTSGFRPGDPRFHGERMATDVELYDQATGQALGNYQDPRYFSQYQQLANAARQAQQEMYPELNNQFRWGGYFSGGKGKYGALDLMHFDLGGNRVGMGGGSWAGGLNPQQAQLWGLNGGGGGQNVLVGSAGGDNLGGGQPQMSIADYIRARAPVYGIDPDVAIRVAQSEGGLDNILRQSDVTKDGVREQSYGPFQLYMNGGLGNRALAAGVDPRTQEGAWKGIDFALAEAGQKGWGQWYGAAKAGIGKMQGISGNGSATPVYDTNMLATLGTPQATGAAAANAVSQATGAAQPGTVGDGGLGDLMMLSQMFAQPQPQPVAAPAPMTQQPEVVMDPRLWLRQRSIA